MLQLFGGPRLIISVSIHVAEGLRSWPILWFSQSPLESEHFKI